MKYTTDEQRLEALKKLADAMNISVTPELCATDNHWSFWDAKYRKDMEAVMNHLVREEDDNDGNK